MRCAGSVFRLVLCGCCLLSRASSWFLSASSSWGLGRMQHGAQMVFEYVLQGQHHTVTDACHDCAPVVIPGGVPSL